MVLISKWTASSEFGTYRLCEQRRFRRACASAQSRQNLRCLPIQAVGWLVVLRLNVPTHTSSESRATFRQKARSLAPLNGWACAVKICNDGMLEDTDSLDGAQILLTERVLKAGAKGSSLGPEINGVLVTMNLRNKVTS